MASDKPSTWFEWWREEWLWVCLFAFIIVLALSDMKCEIRILGDDTEITQEADNGK
jgi:hypothetical protein